MEGLGVRADVDGIRAHRAVDEIDLVGMLVKRWRELLLLTIIGASVGISVALILPKSYRAVTVLAPATGQQTGRSIGGLIGQFAALSGSGLQFSLAGEPTPDEYLAIASSRTFLERFAKERELAPVLFPDEWDSTTKAWKHGDRIPPSPADVSQALREELLEIRTDPDNGLVTLSITWTDPVQAADWANDLVRRLNDSARTRAIREGETGMRYLQAQFDSAIQIPLKNAIGALMEVQLQQIMLARVREDFAFRVVDSALAPEVDDFVAPRPAVMTVFGALAALVLGGVFFLLLERLRILRKNA